MNLYKYYILLIVQDPLLTNIKLLTKLNYVSRRTLKVKYTVLFDFSESDFLH